MNPCSSKHLTPTHQGETVTCSLLKECERRSLNGASWRDCNQTMTTGEKLRRHIVRSSRQLDCAKCLQFICVYLLEFHCKSLTLGIKGLGSFLVSHAFSLEPIRAPATSAHHGIPSADNIRTHTHCYSTDHSHSSPSSISIGANAANAAVHTTNCWPTVAAVCKKCVIWWETDVRIILT